jgi:SpoVK/Ycf46/Vps4 family AAA+-type ATPase
MIINKLNTLDTKGSLLSAIYEKDNLNYYNQFIYLFKKFPSETTVDDENLPENTHWFETEFQSEIIQILNYKNYHESIKILGFTKKIYILKNELIVVFNKLVIENLNSFRILYSQNSIEKANEILEKIKRQIPTNKKELPSVYLIYSANRGYQIRKIELENQKSSINSLYNDDFVPVHKTIMKRLAKENDKGIVLLHGLPGTGKTSYIRYLASKIKKNIIFFPPNLASNITGPDLVEILLNNKNSILIIEDAENLIMDRGHSSNSAVSALLNVADGLLSDCLNIQIICTFNTHINNIDKALLRKGRLIAKYEFKELDTEKANQLSKKLRINYTYTKPVTLTEVYNQSENEFSTETKIKKIGF